MADWVTIDLVEFLKDWGFQFLKVFAGLAALAVWLFVLLGIPMLFFGSELTAGEMQVLVPWIVFWGAVGWAGFITAVDRWAG